VSMPHSSDTAARESFSTAKLSEHHAAGVKAAAAGDDTSIRPAMPRADPNRRREPARVSDG